MSSTDWPQIDSTVAEVSPGTEAPSDLFGGDLFGDELLDMYNSTVVGNGVVEVVDSIPNDILSPPEIPTLLASAKEGIQGSINDLPNPPTKEDLSSQYDGLGVFRPSTSINDFTTLLVNGSPAVAQTKTSESPTTSSIERSLTGSTRKRSHTDLKTSILTSQSNTVNPVHHDKKIATDTKGYTKGQNTNIEAHRSVNPKKAKKESPEVNSIGLNNTTKPKALPPKTAVQNIPIPATNLKGKMMTNSQQSFTILQSGKDAVPSKVVKTEESFKVVAQAAVTNLILSAGSNIQRFESGHNVTDSDSDSIPHLKPVNTSSAHVAALTSNNWVAACAASISSAPPGTAAAAQAAALAAASDPASTKAARARRATLTADERARQNRDRNREHARNTRLRKKAYVEELKRTLTELVGQRDAIELERRHEKQRDLEVREVRYRVMEEFLKLRARGSEANLLARWVAILEDRFTLTLPKTAYRSMEDNNSVTMKRQVSSEDASNLHLQSGNFNSSSQVLRGATECLEDASKVALFINTFTTNNNPHTKGKVTMTYLCDRKHFMMDGVNAVLDWTLTTSGAMAQGVSSELNVRGCMRATFSPASNKLVSAELLFDTGVVISYLSTFSQHDHYNPSGRDTTISNSLTAETDALLDSVLPAVTSSVNNMPLNVAIISNDKGDSSSDEDSPTLPQRKVAVT